MTGLHAGREVRFFHLDEIPDAGARADVAARTHVSPGADDRKIADLAIDHHAIGQHHVFAHDRAGEPGVGPDLAVRADARTASDRGVRQNGHVAREVQIGFEIRRCRIDDRDARAHVVLAQAQVEQRGRRRKLDAIVDAEDARRFGGGHGNDAFSVRDEVRDRIGQVIFGLRVFVAQFGDGRTQFALVVGVETRIHLVDGEFVRRGIPRFDDARYLRAVANDAAEARRQRHARRYECERTRARIDDLTHERRVDQRHVAVEDHDRALARRHHPQRHADRVARAELRFLHDRAHLEMPGRRCEFADLIGYVAAAHHGNVANAGVVEGPQHVPQHRPPANFVQHLRAHALHARAFSGSQNDRARAHAAGGSASSNFFHASFSAFVAPPRRSSAKRRRSRTRSRPKSSIESNSGSDCGLPLTAT